MKKVFFALFIFNMEVSCMERCAVYFDIVHSSVGGTIVVKVAPGSNNVKLIDHEFREKDQLNLSEEEDALEIVVSNANNGIIGMYSSEDTENSLLSFVVQKANNHTPATVSFVNVGQGLMATLYRPSMGGGDNFVLALGRNESDISVSTVQQSQNLGHLQMYFPVSSMFGR